MILHSCLYAFSLTDLLPPFLALQRRNAQRRRRLFRVVDVPGLGYVADSVSQNMQTSWRSLLLRYVQPQPYSFMLPLVSYLHTSVLLFIETSLMIW